MLHSSLFTGFCLAIGILTLVFSNSRYALTSYVLRRVTNTSAERLSLNPSLSGDGRFVVFESSEDITGSGTPGFHALRADLSAVPTTFVQMGSGRVIAPAVSQDGSRIAFASSADPLGTNRDGNSEIFLFDSTHLIQLTNTTAENHDNRIAQGNFQPSISDDGRYVGFSSNRNLTNQNADGNFEVFTCDTTTSVLTQLTNIAGDVGARDAKISGDGSSIVYTRAGSSIVNNNRSLVLQKRLGHDPTRVIAENIPSLTLAYGRSISDDGLRVVYSAESAVNSSQVFLWDGRNDITRQITQLESRADDVQLQATISGDGFRIAFATRRNVTGNNSDHSVELYLFDVPSGQFVAVTTAPAAATAEIISSLNDDGSLVAFNFPRVLLDSNVSTDHANNSEIYVAATPPRPLFGPLSIFNGASLGREPSPTEATAPNSIAVARGMALAHTTQEAKRQTNGSFPLVVAGTSVSVNGVSAQIFFVSPTQVNFLVPPDTETGPANVILTNSDGFRSNANVPILSAAPGIFTLSENGIGEGVILNADTLQHNAFDPSGGNLRLSIFSTGVRNAASVSVAVQGRPLILESVNASRDLPGLDEVHVLVPAIFSGAGIVELVVRADDRESNAAEIAFSGSATRDLVINEVLADPPDGLAGDANHDGVRSSNDDEFVEFINNGGATNISGWTVRTRSSGGTNEVTRHSFAPGSLLLGGEVIVLFGGGSVDPSSPLFGCAQVDEASSGGLSLVNSGLTIVVRDAVGVLVAEFSYGGSSGIEGDENQAVTRAPDIAGPYVLHTLAEAANGRRFSPGLRVNGVPLTTCAGHLASIALAPIATTIAPGETIHLTAQPQDEYGRVINGLTVNFTSDNPAVASIDSIAADEITGIVTATVTGRVVGVAHITAQTSEGVTMIASTPATISVSAPQQPALLVITQIYGGGNNSGATFQNDFVEIFNGGTGAVDFSVTPYSIQYASAAGNFSNANKLDLNAGSVAPGQYFLVRLAGGTTNGSQLPAADASSTAINLSAADGKVALVKGTTLLTGNGCPLGSNVSDFIGYGSANCAEGSAIGSLNATRSARRVSSCGDTNSNSTDFSVVTNPSPPRNSAALRMPCP